LEYIRKSWGLVSPIVAQAVGKVVGTVAWTVLISIASGQLSQNDFGLFVLLTNIAVPLTAIAVCGQSQVIIFENRNQGAPVDRGQRAQKLLSGLKVVVPVGALVALLALVVALVMVGLSSGLVVALLFSLWIPISATQTFIAEESRSVGRIWNASIFTTIAGFGGAFASGLAVLFLLLLRGTLRGADRLDEFLGAMLCASSLALLVPLAQAHVALGQLAVTARSSSPPWRLGVAAAFALLISYLLSQTDVWIVSEVFGVGAAGPYGVATYLARFVSLPGILVAGAYAARLARLMEARDQGLASIEIERLSAWIVSASTAIFLCILIFRIPILQRIFHVRGGIATRVLPSLMLGHLIGSVFGLGPILLAVCGKFTQLLAITSIYAFATVVVATLMAVYSGPVGMATTYAVGYVGFCYTCLQIGAIGLTVRPLRGTLSLIGFGNVRR
jgi:O-antigen/teichoic acid export membrane protein